MSVNGQGLTVVVRSDIGICWSLSEHKKVFKLGVIMDLGVIFVRYAKTRAIGDAIVSWYNGTHEDSHLKINTFLAINFPSVLVPKHKPNKKRRYNNAFHGSKF